MSDRHQTDDGPDVPLVSIVIPCFNLGRYLHTAMDSAHRQSHGCVEVIVVDDGSTDDTAEIVATSPHTRYVRQDNAGLSAARNRGLAEAHGSHIAFLDADDELEPTYVSACLAALDEAGERTAYAYTQVTYFGDREGVSEFPAFDLERLKEKNFVHATAVLVTSVLRQFGYREAMRDGWEDWDLYLTLAEHGWQGVLVDEPLLRYRQRAGSMLGELQDGERKLRLQAELARRHIRLYGWRRVARSNGRFARHLVARRLRLR